jgi:hypothetical protein
MVFGLGKAARLAATMPTLPRLQPQLQSWTSSTLDAVVWADLIGADVMPVMRPAAMAVPAVARARHLTAGTIAGLPLNALRGADIVTPGPYWAQGSDGQVGTLDPEFCDRFGVEAQSTHTRMLWTVDDHIFYGESLWYVTDYSPAGDGRPWRMVRLPWESWDRVYIEQSFRYSFVGADGSELDQSRCIYIPGPHEGILNFAQGTIRGATSLEQTAQDIARRPFRIELHQTTDIELTDAERKALIAATRAALADNNGILFTNAAVETKSHPIDSKELLVEGRNASALDVARAVSMPAAMIDATTVGASLEYATLAGRNQQWIDYGLKLYTDPIAARLSMDDVVPVGQRVAFDTSSLTALDAPASGPATTD